MLSVRLQVVKNIGYFFLFFFAVNCWFNRVKKEEENTGYFCMGFQCGMGESLVMSVTLGGRKYEAGMPGENHIQDHWPRPVPLGPSSCCSRSALDFQSPNQCWR
jgi:hypothetical protein